MIATVHATSKMVQGNASAITLLAQSYLFLQSDNHCQQDVKFDRPDISGTLALPASGNNVPLIRVNSPFAFALPLERIDGTVDRKFLHCSDWVPKPALGQSFVVWQIEPTVGNGLQQIAI